MTALPSRGMDRAGLALLLVVFAAGLLSVAGSFVFEHPDEKHYTDGTIAMVHSGEWVTPRWPDGSLRLEKPILAYWPIALAYRVLGVNLLTSRLHSLLAGALLIAVSYGIALTVTGRRSVALLAALITFSEPHVILAATWAVPDALLCLFIAISGWGALALLLRERPGWWPPWAFYVGAGLAIATKGMLGLLFVGFVWLFAWGYPRAGAARMRFLFHAPSMLVGLAVALWWYAAIAWIHGVGVLGIFFKDQTVAQTVGSPERWWEPLLHVPLYAALAWASVLPWSAALIVLWRRRPEQARADVPDGRFARFALLWSLLVVLISSASMWLDGRYLLPAGPCLAVWLASELAVAGPAAARALRAIFIACAIGLALVGAAFVLLWAAVGQTIGAAVLLGAVAAVMVAVVAAGRWLSPAMGIALATFAAFPIGAAGLTPIAAPDAGVRAAAQEIATAPGHLPRSVLVLGPQVLASKLRVATGGRVAVDRRQIKSWTQLRAARGQWPDAIVLPSAQAAQLDLAGYRTREITLGLDNDVSPGGLLRAVLTGGAAALIEAHRDRYVVAVRE